MSNSSKILVFTAGFCNPCKQLKQKLQSAGLTSNITLIDCEEQPDLVKQYEVRAVPTTIMLDSNGNIASKISGSEQYKFITESV